MAAAVRNMILPSPPFVNVDGIHNFRDIGGYPCSTSVTCEPTSLESESNHLSQTQPPRSTRRGLVYRCADTGRITPEGKVKMRSLGIASIFDLRSFKEIKNAGQEALDNVESMGREEKEKESKENEEAQADEHNGGCEAQNGNEQKTQLIQRYHVPAFPFQDMGPEAIAVRYTGYQSGTVEGFTSAYRDILQATGPACRTVLLHLKDYPTTPFVVHCSAGKDRTGIIIALILKIAGVPDDIIAEEYQLTEVGLGPMRETIVAHLLGNSYDLGGDRNKAENMVGARKDYMLGTLKMLQEEFGGAEAYVKKYCELSDADVIKIRENVTVEAAPIHYTNVLV